MYAIRSYYDFSRPMTADQLTIDAERRAARGETEHAPPLRGRFAVDQRGAPRVAQHLFDLVRTLAHDRRRLGGGIAREPLPQLVEFGASDVCFNNPVMAVQI